VRLTVHDQIRFPLARVVFGFQCQRCGEEHRIGLNSSDFPQLEPEIWKTIEETAISKYEKFVCSKCGAPGEVLFSADLKMIDWRVYRETS
jgi:hypothetical protein